MIGRQRSGRREGRRTPLRARVLLAAAPLLLSIGVALPATAPAPAYAADGRCSPGTGVTVVVDYGALGGGVQYGCDPRGAGRAAVSVMNAAGIDWDYTQGQPFVCRIEGKPSTSQESCQGTPPEDAYWGLFWSDGTRDWTYASQGASSQSAPEGGSIGWRFQSSSTKTKPGAAPTGPAPEPKPEPKPDPNPKPSPKPSPKPTPTSSPTASSSPSSTPSSSASAEAAEQSSASDEVAAKAERGKATADADKKKDGKDEKSVDKDRERASDARDREESTEVPLETDEEDEVVAGGEFVAPVSADSNGLTGADAAMLAVGGLCAAGLAASAVVMARRRRL